ncbi:hypothetical protein DEU56DRAFT_769149 [Suillus clintonianus]|uniref:uncharacterized protein n=1 Tax=Suillus clintonianus TaxID=1904413 RepID=UPI001B869985|nr:uncharacterized protein DEU56DRAFT_769149 [Suillus clintonianus]KAG2154546.1 hypothetical protein DEU56DRAFT_769149 [Suillus clintonianus]
MARRTIVFRCLLVACATLFCVHFFSRRRARVLADLGQTPWEGLAIPNRPLAASFLVGESNSSNVQRASLVSASQSYPDVTAVILNWSRLPNVVQIASLLCSPWLEDVIAEVVVWNNNPREISYRTFVKTGCPSEKLKIYNSPHNAYFQARYVACEQATTRFCFLQDDDYLIMPEIIRTLHARALGTPDHSIHLLPPHEVLSTQLRTAVTSNGVHTSSAWLGHGTILPRTGASDFLALLHHLNASEDEMKMADNYFTILNNRIPEVWFDQGIELGGGQPFTVGMEGDERNKIHMVKASRYLDTLLSRAPHLSQEESRLPFVEIDAVTPVGHHISQAPCLGASCLLQTNIHLLPSNMKAESDSAEDMVMQESRTIQSLGQDAVDHYLRFPPSQAVDGHLDTAFRSPFPARRGDFVSLDMLSRVGSASSTLEIAFLVTRETVVILRQAVFESSTDAVNWVVSTHPLICEETQLTERRGVRSAPRKLQECKVQSQETNHRFFRASLQVDIPSSPHWMIYEFWIRWLT